MIKVKDKFLNILRRISYAIELLGIISIVIIISWFMINANDKFTRIILIPFLIASLAILGKLCSLYFKNINWTIFFHKLYTIGFLIFWVGFLIVADYISINNKQYDMIIFSIPFWIVGIYFAYKNFIKKK